MASENNTNSKLNTIPWYQDGLRFKCTECGQCCTGAPGAVWVSDKEVTAIAEHLGVSEDEFKEKYTQRINGKLSLLDDPKKNYDCVFLDGKRCRIYGLRPVQCRTFPWWPDNLKSEEHWKAAAQLCEGIDDDAPVVPIEEIHRQLAMKMDHQ